MLPVPEPVTDGRRWVRIEMSFSTPHMGPLLRYTPPRSSPRGWRSPANGSAMLRRILFPHQRAPLACFRLASQLASLQRATCKQANVNLTAWRLAIDALSAGRSDASDVYAMGCDEMRRL